MNIDEELNSKKDLIESINDVIKILKEDKSTITSFVFGVTHEDKDNDSSWRTRWVGSYYNKMGLMHVLNDDMKKEITESFVSP